MWFNIALGQYYNITLGQYYNIAPGQYCNIALGRYWFLICISLRPKWEAIPALPRAHTHGQYWDTSSCVVLSHLDQGNIHFYGMPGNWKGKGGFFGNPPNVQRVLLLLWLFNLTQRGGKDDDGLWIGCESRVWRGAIINWTSCCVAAWEICWQQMLALAPGIALDAIANWEMQQKCRLVNASRKHCKNCKWCPCHS